MGPSSPLLVPLHAQIYLIVARTESGSNILLDPDSTIQRPKGACGDPDDRDGSSAQGI